MEAANRGAFDVGGKHRLNIKLPAEQEPNPYITPDLCFQFHYFAMRKMHFLLRAKALVVFPGGFGTLDELFDVLTLRQTGRMQAIPIILFGRKYWEQVVDFHFSRRGSDLRRPSGAHELRGIAARSLGRDPAVPSQFAAELTADQRRRLHNGPWLPALSAVPG